MFLFLGGKLISCVNPKRRHVRESQPRLQYDQNAKAGASANKSEQGPVQLAVVDETGIGNFGARPVQHSPDRRERIAAQLSDSDSADNRLFPGIVSLTRENNNLYNNFIPLWNWLNDGWLNI